MTEDEFISLYTELRWTLLRHARERLGSAEAAKDVVSETFQIAWEKRLKLSELRKEPAAYVMGIGKLVTLQHLQDRSRKPEDAVEAGRIQALVGASSDLAERVVDQQVGREVFEALSPSDRRVLTLMLNPRVSDHEAATRLGVSRQTYAVRVHRVRKRMEEQWSLFENEGGIPNDQ